MKLLTLGQWAVSSSGETTSFLLTGSSFRMMLDVGLNPGRQLAKADVPLTSITHLFASHCHSDHLQGFANLVFTRGVQERRLGPAPRLVVLGTPSTVNGCKTLLQTFYPERTFDIEWVEVTPDSTFDLGNSERLEFFRTEHTVESIGVTVYVGGAKAVVFTGDTALTDQVKEACRGAHLLLGECFGTEADFGPPARQLKHMTAEDLAILAAEARASTLVLFHMQVPYAQSDKRAALIAAIQAGFSGEIVFPEELQEIG